MTKRRLRGLAPLVVVAFFCVLLHLWVGLALMAPAAGLVWWTGGEGYR